MFAQVVPEPGARFDAVLTYSVPASLQDRANVGAQALVPLGKRVVPGFIVRLLDAAPESIEGIKQIVDIPARAPVLPPGIIELARWISDHYVCTLGQALRLALPSGAVARIKRLVRLADSTAAERARQQRPEYSCVVDALAAGKEIAVQTLKRRLPQVDIIAALDWLKARKAVQTREVIAGPAASVRPPKARDPLLEPALPAAELRAQAAILARRAPAQARSLRAAVRTKRPVRASALAKRAHSTRAAVMALVKRNLLRTCEERAAPRRTRRRPLMFTLHEGAALRQINSAADEARAEVFVLGGLPGSARTQVCMSAVEHALTGGKQAIILAPEISLAQKHADELRARCGAPVALLHGDLSSARRRQEWHDIESGTARIVVGTRSAIFAPCQELGLIVVDDEHDESYKQEDAPRANARDVAVARGTIETCPVVLSSSTPSLDSLHRANQKRCHLLSLPPRPRWRGPAVTVVDMKGAPRTTCSGKLVLAVKRALDGGGKALLILPRKGFSPLLLCGDCGHAARCPQCDLCLTYHLPGRQLICHHCGHSQPAPDLCPHCGGRRFVARGFGTQQVEQQIRRACPSARVVRLEANGNEKRQHVGAANVIISTGLTPITRHIARVTLVGMISADTWLNRPDFRAGERTFQFLMQASARAAEARRGGHLVIQTYQPENYAIQAVVLQDPPAFYDAELAARREHGFPPFSAMAAVLIAARAQHQAEQAAHALAQAMGAHARVRLLGPAPASLPRLKGRYRWQILALAQDHERLLPAVRAAARELPRNLRDISVTVDVDPMSLL
jgi:primosomal protein N' (replication factor Y)